MEIHLADRPDDADRAVILDGLLASNRARAGDAGHAVLALLLRDGTRTVGGLWGRFSHGWLFVELLYVPERAQGQGQGAALLARAEAVAGARGCRGLWLDTYGFQAPGFYRKQGFTVFGELDDCPPGRGSRFFFKKLLPAGPAPS